VQLLGKQLPTLLEGIMRKLCAIFCLFFASFSAVAYAEGRELEAPPRLVSLPLSEASGQLTFGYNDRITFLVSGQTENLCYRPVYVTAKLEGNRVYVTQRAYLYAGKCLKMAFPFVSSVTSISHLQYQMPGVYEIIDNESGKTLNYLNVSAIPHLKMLTESSRD